MDGHSATSSITALRRQPRWLVPALAVMVGYYLAARLGSLHAAAAPDLHAVAAERAARSRRCSSPRTRAGGGCSPRRCRRTSSPSCKAACRPRMVLGWYASNCSEALHRRRAACARSCPALRLDSLRSVAILLLGAACWRRRSCSSFLDAALRPADRLRARRRLLELVAHAFLRQRARRADHRAADPDLGGRVWPAGLRGLRRCAARRSGGVLPPGCSRSAWRCSTCRIAARTPRPRCSTRRCRSCCGRRCASARAASPARCG